MAALVRAAVKSRGVGRKGKKVQGRLTRGVGLAVAQAERRGEGGGAGLCDVLVGPAKRAGCCAWESRPVRFGPVVLGCVLGLAGRFLLGDLGKAGLGAGFGSKSRLG